MADWSALPADLLHLISQLLPTTIEVIRIRSVCGTWRTAVPPPPASPARFPVIPNSGISETSWGFHLTKRTIYFLRSPFPDQSSWIIKLDGDKMHLFNPLDRSQLKSSPKLFSFFDIGVRELVEDYALQHINFRPTASSISGESENLYMEKVAVLNNGSGGFVLLTIHVSVDTTGQIVVVNTDDMNVSVAARSIFGGDKKLLVDCDGELLVVDMHLGLKPADDLASAGEVFCDEKCRGNCIFFTDQHCYREDEEGLMACCVGMFDLESGSIGPVDGYSEIFWPPPDWVYSTK
ncbi:F-box protein SKIP23-like isoform X2 [Salvia divinorum]|uniref:F-box protein SKIP23-like isoform X2 n=1 Tax=Salvia divinorum TaxID=28513 RepID=A0ABD1HD77_SALDI